MVFLSILTDTSFVSFSLFLSCASAAMALLLKLWGSETKSNFPVFLIGCNPFSHSTVLYAGVSHTPQELTHRENQKSPLCRACNAGNLCGASPAWCLSVFSSAEALKGVEHLTVAVHPIHYPIIVLLTQHLHISQVC